jgi:hypothetical protein
MSAHRAPLPITRAEVRTTLFERYAHLPAVVARFPVGDAAQIARSAPDPFAFCPLHGVFLTEMYLGHMRGRR